MEERRYLCSLEMDADVEEEMTKVHQKHHNDSCASSFELSPDNVMYINIFIRPLE